MKTTSSRSWVSLCFALVATLAIGTSASATAILVDVLVDTENEFSGTFSARVGYIDPDSGMDDGKQNVVVTGLMPGSKFRIGGQLYSGAGVSLENEASVLEQEDVSFSGSWYGWAYNESLEANLSNHHLLLTIDYSFGGWNDGYDPDPEKMLWPEDFWWGYWEGTFSIKRIAGSPVEDIPEQGPGNCLLLVALGVMVQARRFKKPGA